MRNNTANIVALSIFLVFVSFFSLTFYYNFDYANEIKIGYDDIDNLLSTKM